MGVWPTRMFQTDPLSRLELIKFECLQLAVNDHWIKQERDNSGECLRALAIEGESISIKINRLYQLLTNQIIN